MLLYLGTAGLPPGYTYRPEEGNKRGRSNSYKSAVIQILEKIK